MYKSIISVLLNCTLSLHISLSLYSFKEFPSTPLKAETST